MAPVAPLAATMGTVSVGVVPLYTPNMPRDIPGYLEPAFADATPQQFDKRLGACMLAVGKRRSWHRRLRH